jgi:transcriptional regulator with XRE-family HTH domain
MVNSIGSRIRQRRLELGLSQIELAKKMGYTSKSTIAKIESGVNDISRSNITLFANALDTTEAELMGWSESNPDFDEFTYAMHNETKNLSEEEKLTILNMVKTFKKALGK